MSEETKPQANKASLGHVWHGFSQDTTFHGVRFVTMHQAGFGRRILWALVILTASVYLIYQIQDRIVFFLSEPILVSVAITFKDTLQFPSIAICNQNQFRFTAAVDSKYNTYLEEIFNNHALKPNVTLEQLNSTAMNETYMPKPTEVGILTRSKQSYEKFVAQTWETLQTSLGHRVDDMIIRCHFSMEECSAKDFQPIMTDHGLCYKFKGLNNSGKGYQLPFAQDAGSREGLNLLLNVESYEYSPGEHASAGFKVVLLDPDDIPMIRSQGEGIGPGTYTFVALEPQKTERINSRTTKCIHAGYNLTYFDKYTEMACQENCKAMEYVTKYGCRKSSRWNDHRNGAPSTPLCTVAHTLSSTASTEPATNLTTNETASTEKPTQEEVASGVTSTQSCLQLCTPPCFAMDYHTSFSFLKTAANDINQLDKKDLEKILKDNEKARDYRINTDKDRYKVYLDAIKEFKKVTRDTALVYGKTYADSVRDRRSNFQVETLNCSQSLNDTATYFEKMYDFYDEYFYGPASQNFPDATVGARSLIRNVEEALRPTTDPDFKKFVEFEIESARIALNDSMPALAGIFYSYGNYTPVVPDTNITDYNNSVGFDGIYMTKPLTDVGANMVKLTGEYNEIATKNVKFLKSLANALKASDEAFVSKEKKRFLDDMSKLGYIRRNLIEKTFREPASTSTWLSSELLATQEHARTIADTMIKDMGDGHFDSYVTNSNYDKWVALLSESGFLDVSKYAKVAHEVDGGRLEERFGTVVNSMRQYLTESHQRFSRLETNFKLYKQTVTKASKKAKGLIVEGVPASQNDELLEILKIDSCLDIAESSQNWDEYFKGQRINSQNVMGLIVSRFEKLKSLLDEYIPFLQGGGTFYKENFAAVDVFFQEMSYQTVTQSKAYDLTALLSDIGGSMGLLIGGSCLTVCELIDTIAFSLAVFWARRAKTNVLKTPCEQ